MRPLMREALETLLEGEARIPLVIAPTGYGKTRASPEIYHEARRAGLARGLVHVAPLRSLVTKIYSENFSHIPGSGYQMSDPEPSPGKSPYLMRDLVVTTVDSYLWNLYKVPVLEYEKIERGVSEGHYYPALAAIMASVNVLDEAHVYLGEGPPEVGQASVLAALTFLAYTRTPTILETATMPPEVIHAIVRALRQARTTTGEKPTLRLVAHRCLLERLEGRLPRGVEALPVEEEAVESVRWETRPYKSWTEAIPDMLRLAREGLVLAVSNTVRGAVELYHMLPGSMERVLIHGRLASSDRRRAEEMLSEMERGIVVATQVVEVGVDVNSIAVFTEPAPLENLVQRAGRACRRGSSLEWCHANGGHVGIVLEQEGSVYPEQAVDWTIRTVLEHRDRLDWRSLCPAEGRVSYYDLHPRQGGRLLGRLSVLTSIFLDYLRHEGSPSRLLEVLDDTGACNIFRGSMMIPVLTQRGPVTVSLPWALSPRGGLNSLRKCDGAPCMVALREGKPCGRAPARALAVEAQRGKPSCKRIAEAARKDLAGAARECGSGPVTWALEASPEGYREGLGLAV